MRTKQILVAALTAALIAGCGAPPAKEPSPPPPSGGSAPGAGSGSGGVAYNKLQWEEVPAGQLPQAVSAFIEANREKGGTLAHSEGEYTYLVILAGERNTGGYHIVVDSVGDVEGKIEIVYHVEAPGQGQVVTMALTYPEKVIRIPRHDLPVQFKQG